MQSIIWWEDFKFLFYFLTSQTRQTNGSFKSCNSHINACHNAASTESKCLYSWLDSGMQIWDWQPELWRWRGSWKYQRVGNFGVYKCHGETEPSSNQCWLCQSLDLSAEKYMGRGKRTREKNLHWQGYWSFYSCLWHHSAEGWTRAIQACFTPDKGTSHLDLVLLIQACSNAMTSTLKTQILSLYAYRYPVKTLQKIHKPYSIRYWNSVNRKTLLRTELN